MYKKISSSIQTNRLLWIWLLENKNNEKKAETDTNVLHKTQISYKGITQAIKKHFQN